MADIIEQPSLTAQHIFRSYEMRGEVFRPHLGASEIGGKCPRANWYSFRWAARKIFKGRMLRLVERGNREEDVIVKNLRDIGVTVHAHAADGKQFEVKWFGGHVAGHMDGAGLGLPEAPTVWHLLEFKTANVKRFKDLVAKGVKASKPEHWHQCNCYMGGMGLQRAAYFAVCKDNDEIHVEFLDFDPEVYAIDLERAKQVVFSPEPPPRISNNPTWFECKFCDYHAICHTTRMPLVNCRTCGHSTPEEDGRWSCARRGIPSLDQPAQLSACMDHRYIPILLEKIATPVAASDEQNWVQYELKPAFDGGKFVNGPSPGFSSQEIFNCKQPSILGHEAIENIKAQFPGARIINEQPVNTTGPEQGAGSVAGHQSAGSAPADSDLWGPGSYDFP